MCHGISRTSFTMVNRRKVLQVSHGNPVAHVQPFVGVSYMKQVSHVKRGFACETSITRFLFGRNRQNTSSVQHVEPDFAVRGNHPNATHVSQLRDAKHASLPACWLACLLARLLAPSFIYETFKRRSSLASGRRDSTVHRPADAPFGQPRATPLLGPKNRRS